MGRSSSRQRIVEAAAAVLARDGAANLTLEAVAREAGVSKGGLLYHFPSKDAMIRGMLETVNHEFEAALESQPRDGKPGQFARAYINASFAFEEGLFPVVAGMLAAAANQPDLLEPLRDAFASWQVRLENDGLDPVRATVIRLAVDGLWFADLFSLATPHGPQRDRLREQLLELTRC